MRATTLLGRLATALAAAAALAISLALLVRAAEPIGTGDLFWHLALGRHVLEHGAPLEVDIFSHTAAGAPDVPQQWLSEAVYALVERAGGWYALRALAGVVLLGCLAAAWRTLRRQGAPIAGAAAGIAALGATSFWWLLQLRPHGFSFIALLLFCALIEKRLTPRRAAALALLGFVWAQLHAVGLLAPLIALGITMVEGAALVARRRGLYEAEMADDPPQPLAALLLTALLVGLSLLTPSGVDLYRFAYGGDPALRLIRDEWARLAVFGPQPFPKLEGAPYLAAVISFALFGVTLLAALATKAGRSRIARERRRVALAGFGALLASRAVRFLFALLLPVGWALGELKRALGDRERAPARAALGSALGAAAALALLFAWVTTLDGRMIHADSFDEWRQPRLEKKLFPEMVRFLAEAGVEGHLWNHYNVGGQLLYALHPRCLVFIDARTLVYRSELILTSKLIERGIDAERLLDEHRVDVFVGVGFLGVPGMGYETLEGAPGWIQVFRSQEVVVRLRRGAPRTEENLARIAHYYEARGIPFDREKGFDPVAAFDADRGWAVDMGIVPRDLAAPLPAGASDREKVERVFALGLVFERLGAYERAAAQLEAVLMMAPDAHEARRALERVRARLAR